MGFSVTFDNIGYIGKNVNSLYLHLKKQGNSNLALLVVYGHSLVSVTCVAKDLMLAPEKELIKTLDNLRKVKKKLEKYQSCDSDDIEYYFNRLFKAINVSEGYVVVNSTLSEVSVDYMAYTLHSRIKDFRNGG